MMLGSKPISKRARSWLLKILFLFTNFISLPTLAQIYTLDWEDGKLGANCSGNCPVISSDVSRSGSHSMKSVVNRLTSPTSFRTEITKPGIRKKMKFETDYWYGFSTYMPSDWEVPNRFEIVAQIHASPDPNEPHTVPPLAINSGSGIWRVLTRWENGKKYWELNSVKEDLGRWVDWVIHYKPSWKSTGVTEVWKDGSLVARRLGPNTYEDSAGPYFKLGLYLGWKDRACCEGYRAEKIIYHDEFRVGVGEDIRYEDVTPAAKSAPTH
jgi:hypothetical protein